MGIFSRMTDILNANINAMLDKAEDPAKMVRLIIQEMEETLVEVRTSAARTIADKKELQRKREYHVDDSAEWKHKAEVALRKSREDLARAALAERRKSQDTIERLEEQLIAVDDMLTHMNEDIATLTHKLKDAKSRQTALVVRGKTAKARLNVRKQLSGDNVDEAMIRFEQYERRMDDLEGQVESYDLGEQRTLSDEIHSLESEERVDSDLEELKRELNEREAN